jgi:hypothetical protein
VKKLFSVFLFLALGLVLSQCELENPNYPVEPSINFKNIEFTEVPGAGTNDSLILTINYRDGDKDLGLTNDWNEIEYSRYPYHQTYYFLEDGAGDTTRVYSELIKIETGEYYYYILKVPNNATGKLVTNKTRLKPNYGYLPEYIHNNCLQYLVDRILVPDYLADNTYNIQDTVFIAPNQRYFLIDDPLLYEFNENFFNIFVEFYISDDGLNFTEFNWMKYCYNYNLRFPFLEGTGIFKSGPFQIVAKTPWKGEIRYGLANPSFLAIFGTKKMKLKIKIKDRALHTSNVIETPVFTLDEIRKN